MGEVTFDVLVALDVFGAFVVVVLLVVPAVVGVVVLVVLEPTVVVMSLSASCDPSESLMYALMTWVPGDREDASKENP